MYGITQVFLEKGMLYFCLMTYSIHRVNDCYHPCRRCMYGLFSCCCVSAGSRHSGPRTSSLREHVQGQVFGRPPGWDEPRGGPEWAWQQTTLPHPPVLHQGHAGRWGQPLSLQWKWINRRFLMSDSHQTLPLFVSRQPRWSPLPLPWIQMMCLCWRLPRLCIYGRGRDRPERRWMRLGMLPACLEELSRRWRRARSQVRAEDKAWICAG